MSDSHILRNDADVRAVVDNVCERGDIALPELDLLLRTDDRPSVEYLHAKAREVAQSVYGKQVYMRGLIEFSSHCRNNCNYCGLRRANRGLPRYRLTDEVILQCCRQGYECGMRTFVLQSGEDAYYTDERLCRLVGRIRAEFPDCAITLSVGERPRESYRALRDAGADRYLLRHETADRHHYGVLHPGEMSFDRRMQCLHDLRDLGYQVGAGFMTGSPGQTTATLFSDLQFIKSFKPEMCGIGPFIATRNTPFAQEPSGTVEMTLRLLSIIRLLHPHVLLPATTALGSLNPFGRELGIKAGANVVMPNLSPEVNRRQYNIYDGKICLGDDITHCRSCLEQRIRSTGYELVVARGDFK